MRPGWREGGRGGGGDARGKPTAGYNVAITTDRQWCEERGGARGEEERGGGRGE